MNYSFGIRTQLIAGIVITTLAGIGFIGVIAVSLVERNALYRKVREAETVARIFRTATVSQTVKAGGGGAVRYLQDMMRQARVKDLVVTDTKGRKFFGDGATEAPGGELFYFLDGIQIRRVGGGIFNGVGEMLHVTVGQGQRTRASLEAVFSISLDDIARDMSYMRRFLLFYAAVDAVIIIALGTYFISRFIVVPIKRLEASAVRIEGGDLDERAEVWADNEIGLLAGAFNTMAERLKGEIKRLERLNRELVETQEELLRSSTLASVGKLAAGIAHEIGNPLGAVRGYLDILKDSSASSSHASPSERATSDENRDILERTDKEITRINEIVKEFLELSRPSNEPARALDVNSLLDETLSILAQHPGFAGVKSELLLQSSLSPVMIDEGKLRQVFMNLLLNAAGAMSGIEGEKVVTVRTGTNRRIDEPRGEKDRRSGDPVFKSGHVEEHEREFVFIRFSDTGCGIKEEDKARVFDPFFTTKGAGEGTGLGLFVSQSIIKTYGGTIEVTSEEGRGSEFTAYLPALKL